MSSARLAFALTRRTPVAPLIARAGPSAARRSYAAAPSATTPAAAVEPATDAAKAGPSHPPSSTPAGTPIPEVVIYANQATPLAMEDHEYPDWLWNLIGSGRAANKKSLGAQDESRGTKWSENQAKRLVRKTNREAIKTSNLLKSS